MSTTRTFVAVHLSPELVSRLTALEDHFRGLPGGNAVRWVPPESMHLTLKFLGEVEDSRLPRIFQTVSAVCARSVPFRLTVAGAGCFPDWLRPRIIWAGITEGGLELVTLAAELDAVLAALGFPRERRPFSAHITLGRMDRRASQSELAVFGRSIADQSVGELGSLVADHVNVVKSDLRPQGPLYTDLFVCPLAPESEA